MDEILKDREERYNKILELVEKYSLPVLCGKLNYPGSNKNTREAEKGFLILSEVMSSVFNKYMLYSTIHAGIDGKSMLMVINTQHIKAKKLCVEIEEKHDLGRIFDLDIYDLEGIPVDRRSLGMAPRSCILCRDDARVCMRNGKHELAEVLRLINDKIIKYGEEMEYGYNDFSIGKFNISSQAFRIGEAALLGMLFEAGCSPSPGLVSPVSMGAHEDMDFFTFLRSSSAITYSMYLCAQAGIDFEGEDILGYLRPIGISAENRMYNATGGINTQKGLLFLAGIICASSGRCIRKGGKLDRWNISSECRKVCEGIVDRELRNLDGNKDNSKGENIYRKYGFEGIRGEVQRGIPTVINIGLPAYEEAIEYGLKTGEALCHSLVNIMAVVQDTNVLSRRGAEGLKLMHDHASKAVELGGMKTSKGHDYIVKMDGIFKKHNISPGGAADLLAVTVMIHKLELDGELM